MIPDRDLVVINAVDSPFTSGVYTREAGLQMVPNGADGPYYLTAVPSCRCCGEPAWENLRCTKHQNFNPCAVGGCKRTFGARGWLSEDHRLCGEHYRAFVPPGSPTRRTLNRLARMAKRLGYRRTDVWPEPLEGRWWRVWRGILRRVRRGVPEGHIDQKAIERMFGWDD